VAVWLPLNAREACCRNVFRNCDTSLRSDSFVYTDLNTVKNFLPAGSNGKRGGEGQTSKFFMRSSIFGDAACDHRARHDLTEFIERQAIPYEAARLIDEPASSVSDVLVQLNGKDLVIACIAGSDREASPRDFAPRKSQHFDGRCRVGRFCQDIENFDIEKMTCQFSRLKKRQTV